MWEHPQPPAIPPPAPASSGSTRRVLPPLLAPPADAAASPHSSLDQDPTLASSDPLSASICGKDAMCSKIDVVDLIANHLRYARCFRENDVAKLMPFLDKSVTLKTLNGTLIQGQAAVLAHLVSPKMERLARQLHIKGQPSRTGARRSVFTYEHGFVFHQPLFAEVIEWSLPGIALSITHMPVAQAYSTKTFNEIVEEPLQSSRRSLSGRTDSTSDLTDESVGNAPEIGRRSSVSSGYSTVLETITMRNVTPVRNRKVQNPFLTIVKRMGQRKVTWRSPTCRRSSSPVWKSVGMALSSSDVTLDMTLWDEGRFRDVKVATLSITVSELLQHSQVAGRSLLCLYGATDPSSPPIEVRLEYASGVPPSSQRLSEQQDNSQRKPEAVNRQQSSQDATSKVKSHQVENTVQLSPSSWVSRELLTFKCFISVAILAVLAVLIMRGVGVEMQFVMHHGSS